MFSKASCEWLYSTHRQYCERYDLARPTVLLKVTSQELPYRVQEMYPTDEFVAIAYDDGEKRAVKTADRGIAWPLAMIPYGCIEWMEIDPSVQSVGVFGFHPNDGEKKG